MAFFADGLVRPSHPRRRSSRSLPKKRRSRSRSRSVSASPAARLRSRSTSHLPFASLFPETAHHRHSGSVFGLANSSRSSFFGLGGMSSSLPPPPPFPSSSPPPRRPLTPPSQTASRPSYYKRSPRYGFLQRAYRQLRRLLRDLVHYAKRHPWKVFFLVVSALVFFACRRTSRRGRRLQMIPCPCYYALLPPIFRELRDTPLTRVVDFLETFLTAGTRGCGRSRCEHASDTVRLIVRSSILPDPLKNCLQSPYSLHAARQSRPSDLHCRALPSFQPVRPNRLVFSLRGVEHQVQNVKIYIASMYIREPTKRTNMDQNKSHQVRRGLGFYPVADRLPERKLSRSRGEDTPACECRIRQGGRSCPISRTASFGPVDSWSCCPWIAPSCSPGRYPASPPSRACSFLHGRC